VDAFSGSALDHNPQFSTAAISLAISRKLISLKELALRIGVRYSTVRRVVAGKSVCVVKPRLRAMILRACSCTSGQGAMGDEGFTR
jgi:hypothetical protein